MALNLLVAVTVCVLCYGVQSISDVKQSPGMAVDEPKRISVLPNIESEEFDCVDIYKQPAFDHPLLRNHKLQLNPSFSEKQVKSRASSVIDSLAEINLKSKGCPSGMVPIQRSKFNDQFGQELTQKFPGQHFATFDTSKKSTYHGGSAYINLNNPSVTKDQFSKALIWLQSGPDPELNSIQAGWAVHPNLYGDNITRMTIQWTADGFQKTGCYNALCPGFVQVHPVVHPGLRFRDISIPGGAEYIVELHISQERSSGNWWLTTQDNLKVGYWPKELFPHLGSGASLVRFGGTTKASPEDLSPQMGSGAIPSKDYKRVGYFAQTKIVNSDFIEVDLDEADGYATLDSPTSCYDIFHFGNQGHNLRDTFSYGGPGGASCGV